MSTLKRSKKSGGKMEVVKTLDPFTRARLKKFTLVFRQKTAQLPTLPDYQKEGFKPAIIEKAVKDCLLVPLYVPMTNGSLVKGYKVASE